MDLMNLNFLEEIWDSNDLCLTHNADTCTEKWNGASPNIPPQIRMLPPIGDRYRNPPIKDRKRNIPITDQYRNRPVASSNNNARSNQSVHVTLEHENAQRQPYQMIGACRNFSRNLQNYVARGIHRMPALRNNRCMWNILDDCIGRHGECKPPGENEKNGS